VAPLPHKGGGQWHVGLHLTLGVICWGLTNNRLFLFWQFHLGSTTGYRQVTKWKAQRWVPGSLSPYVDNFTSPCCFLTVDTFHNFWHFNAYCWQFSLILPLPSDIDIFKHLWHCCPSLMLTRVYLQNLEDEIFLKRHQKPEADERRRKRYGH